MAVNALKMVNVDPELTSGLFTRMSDSEYGILISDKTMSRELWPDRRWQGRV